MPRRRTRGSIPLMMMRTPTCSTTSSSLTTNKRMTRGPLQLIWLPQVPHGLRHGARCHGARQRATLLLHRVRWHLRELAILLGHPSDQGLLSERWANAYLSTTMLLIKESQNKVSNELTCIIFRHYRDPNVTLKV